MFAPTAPSTPSLDANIAEKSQQNTVVQNAALKDPIKMTNIILTMKIMPESPDVNLAVILKKAEALIKKATGSVEVQHKIEPVAFGLNALNVTFVADEKKGSPDELEKQLQHIKGVQSVEITDVRRAIG